MSAFNPGDVVSVNAPFNEVFPGTYVVEAWDGSANALIAGGRGFADEFLTLVEAGGGAPPEDAIAHITNFAFENRFTLAELIAVNIASLDNAAADMPTRQFAAALRVMRQKLDAAKFVDLLHPETIAGVNQLEQVGLLASGRAAEILSLTILSEERA
jgi:hypothetical protein